MSEHMLKFSEQFPQYTKDNLETEGVVPVSFYHVHESHPVIFLLKANPEILCGSIDDSRDTGGYFKLSKLVFDTCCNTIRERVFMADVLMFP